MPKRLLLAVTCLFAFVCRAQTVQPLFQPHQTFVDLAGSPCSGCQLFSYAAGTTTPQATYTDSSGTIQNTNPVVLDAAGGANVWMGQSAYKFALLDTYGTPLWTVDNVRAPTPGGQGPFLPLAGGTMTGAINMGTHNLLNASQIGVGTSTPSWAIDVENGEVNANGFLFNGAAPANHILLGNGTYYVDSASFPWASLSGVPTFYYQTVQGIGIGAAQEPALNFSNAFAVTDTAGASTNIAPATIGSGGSCSLCSVTYDSFGRVTAASTGAPPGGITAEGSGPGCYFANDGNGLTCTTTVTIPAMPDANYTAVCSPQFSAAVASTTSAMPALGLGWSVASSTSITIYEALNNGTSTGFGISPSYGVTVYCVAHHA